MPDARFRVVSDQRTIVIGKTGSGKSYFAQYLTMDLPRLIVCDSKGDVDADQWKLQPYTPQAFKRMVKDRKAPMRLHIGPQTGDEWATHFKAFLTLRNVVIEIDELAQLGAAVTSEELRGLFTRGRSLGIGVIACTQRPARVPLESMTEAEHYVIFQLKMGKDQDRVFELIGNTGFEELQRWNVGNFADLKKYQFLMYSDPDDDAQLYDRLDVTIKGVAPNGN